MNTSTSEVESLRARVFALRTHGWRLLHERSKVPFSTIRKFAYGEVRVPLYDTMQSIKTSLPKVEAACSKAAA